jgi:hypothetical protein
MPPPITDKPADAEPRQVSTPAAARPGATTVGVVIKWFVEVAGLLMSTVDAAPDVLPKVWAYAGVVIRSIVNITKARMKHSGAKSYKYYDF